MKVAVFVDFDDTTTTRNVAHFLLRRYAPEATERFTGLYRAGEMTFREYQENSFNAVEATVEEMQQAVVAEIALRPGFRELAETVRRGGGTLTVTSAGLRFYIEPLLEREGIPAVTVVCADAVRNEAKSGRFRYDYPSGLSSCMGDWATCKCRPLESAPDEAVTVFVGDGLTSDACAAPKADYVFARDRLLEHCLAHGIAATPFEDFTSITAFVAQLQEQQPEKRPDPR